MSLLRRVVIGYVAVGLLALVTIESVRAADFAATVYKVKPSAADPKIRHGDFASWVLFDPDAPVDTPLVLFLPGTHGKPGNRHEMALMDLIVAQGYRVIWLTYDNAISGKKICPQSPDPACSEQYVRMRVYGRGPAPVSNPMDESIVERLTHLLIALDHEHPKQGWGRYLANDSPDWKHMVIAGLSQGAEMAAYIAKTHEVTRVVLFSSPWDDFRTGYRKNVPAPWLYMPSATPVDRWFAEFNRREDTAKLISRAYGALRIPANHIRVFDLDLPAGYLQKHKKNPYHAVTIRDPRYAPEWKAMFGSPQATHSPD